MVELVPLLPCWSYPMETWFCRIHRCRHLINIPIHRLPSIVIGGGRQAPGSEEVDDRFVASLSACLEETDAAAAKSAAMGERIVALVGSAESLDRVPASIRRCFTHEVCMCVFIKQDITAQSGPVILVFQSYRYGSTLSMGHQRLCLFLFHLSDEYVLSPVCWMSVPRSFFTSFSICIIN